MEFKINPWTVTGCLIKVPFGLKKHKGKGHRCEFCSKLFRSVKAKLNHISYRHNFQCHMCAKTFSFKKDLKHHECQPEENRVILKQKSNLKRVELYQCELCPKIYISKTGLKKHKRKKHQCEICSLTYRSVQEKLKHECDIDSDYYCLYCQTSFCSKDAEYYMCMDKCNRGYYGENESEDDWFY